MAILFDNRYYKILKNVVNYENNTTEIEMLVYSTKETREREKMFKQQADDFVQKVQSYLYENMNNLLLETNKIQPIETIANKEYFFILHPEIKLKADEIEKIQTEGLFLIDNILKKDIDISMLKFLHKWEALGLNENICRKIEIIGTLKLSVDKIIPNDPPLLYTAVKEKIVSEVIDC